MTRKVVSPIALDRSINTTEQTPRNIADVLAQQLAAIKTAIESGNGNLEAAFVCYYGVTTATQINQAIEDGKVPYFYYNGSVAQLWKVETDKYTFRTTNTRSVEGQTILDVVDYVVNGSVWSTVTREVSGGSSSGQSYIASVNSLADFDTTGKSGMQDLVSVANVPADGVYQVSVMLHITPKTASATKSDLVLQFTSSDNTGWPSHTFHAVVDDSQTFAQQLSFSTSVSLKAGENTLRIQCGGLNTEYLAFVDELTVAQLVNGVYHNGDDFADVHTLAEAPEFNNDDGFLVDGATGGPRFMHWQAMSSAVNKMSIPLWNKAYAYPTYSIVQKNNKVYQAKHRVDYNTEFSSDDWEQVDLSSINRDVVHLSGNNIALDEKTIKGCYIGLGDVGETISLDYVNNVSYDCLKIPVKKGYKFQFKGQGGATPRLWGLVDNELKICQVANENQYQGNYGNVVSNQDGFLIFNANNSSTYSLIFSPFDAETIEVLTNYIENMKYKIDLLQYSNDGQYISLDGLNVGDSVDIENFVGSSTYNGIIIPVKEGDLVEVKGSSGNAPRLWCVTDVSYTIKSLSSAGYYSNKLTTLLVKEDGFFIGSYDNTSLGYKAEFNLISSNERILDIVSNTASSLVKNKVLSLDCFLIEGLLANCDVGSSVSFNSNVSFRTLKYPCNKGDIFEIKGAGGTTAPLYAFTDLNGVVTDVSEQSLVISSLQYIVAPNDGFFVYNCYTNTESTVNYKYKDFGSVSKIADVDKLQKFDLKSVAALGQYIDLNYNVGDIVEENLYESNDYSFVIIPVKYGDVIQINNVSSGNKPRLWCITDTDKRVLKLASSSQYYSSTYSIFVESDGFAYIDYKDYSGISEINFVGTQNRVNTIIQSSYLATKNIVKNENICIENKNFIELKCVNTSGSTVDLSTLTTNKNIRILIMDCNVGDKFIITGHGATAYRLWAFVDNDGNIVSKADAGIVLNGKEVVSPINGKFVMQSFIHSAPTEYKLLTNNKEFSQSQLNETQNKVFDIDKYKPVFCSFAENYDFKDYENEIETFDFSGNMCSQVQDHFDALISSNSEYISKVDIYEELGIDYPAYAGYHTYMYKLEGDLDCMGNLNGRHPKKKVFIVSGLHGDEIAAPVNTYLLAKNLCEVVDDLYFKLRSSCNFYIIPCVNGYGMIHNQRDNGNGVDINRNFPIAAWVEDGQGTSQYTGPSAGSEAETKIVMGAFNLIKPNVGIDHHNYGNTSYQLYGSCSSEEVSNIFYNSFTECSYALVKNLPEYFGNKFKIFNNPDAPKVLASYENPTTNRWMYEQGLIDECTCEISNNINYRNGSPYTGDQLEYNHIVWSVGEYTLRNLLVNLVKHTINTSN